ncbi:chromosomal replication initiator protein DnaA [Patescibacteria group bacterium]
MEKNKIWKTVLENLKINLSPANFSTWFPQTFINQTKIVDKKRLIVEIGCPSEFVRNTVETRYYGLIKNALDQATEKKCNLVFLIKQDKREKNQDLKGKNGPLFEIKAKPLNKNNLVRKVGLRPDFNFDNFAVSSTNQMAHAAAGAVVQSPGHAYNPLFFYGGVGVGKTHLMQAIAQAILAQKPETKIVYCTSEEFTNEIVNAIRRKSTENFKIKFRSAKVLLVDDIQFIAGKDRAQEEFFHTFNTIVRVGGQVILTSDCPPSEISQLEDRLRSRFEGGLTIDIQDPDFELRTAILLIKAQQQNFKLPMDIAQLIASNITSTRRLEGFLTRLITEIKTKNEVLAPEIVSALLGQTNETIIPNKLIKPKEMIRTVALHYNLKISQLTGARRNKPIVVPRQILMYLLRTELELPLMEIGRYLGGRDHTTIMHGVDKVTQVLPKSEDMRVDIAGIKKKLYG